MSEKVSTEVTILSLQKTSCLYILSNLKNFSISTLSMLPIKIRNELLINIPVHEMWFLEQSKFVEGIDMKSVWTSIIKQRMPSKFADNLNVAPLNRCSPNMRQKYLETLGFLILNKVWNDGSNINHYQLVLDLIFSVHHCMGVSYWRKFLGNNPHWRKHFHSFPPPRHHIVVPTKYFKYYDTEESCGVSDVQLISLFVDGCCYNPTQMNIFAPSFLKTHIWEEIAYPSVLERFRRFTLTTENLWFCTSGGMEKPCEAHLKIFSDMLSFIVTEMLTSPGGGNQLKLLHLQAPNVTSLSHLLHSISHFFAVLTNYESIRTKNCTPYKQMKELTLCHEEQPQHVAVDMYSLDLLFRNMSDVITYQYYLKEINLGGINFACATQNLRGIVTALVQHLNRENGCTLSFKACHMMLYFFQMVIEAFLRSTVFNDQVLSMSQVVVDRTTIMKQSEVFTSIISAPEEGYKFKHYKFSDMHFPHPTGFWLFHRVHLIRLHTLELHNVRVDPGCNILNEIAKHPQFRVKRIILSKIDIPHCYNTVDDFQHLLMKPELEELSISDCNIGLNGVLLDITIAFSLLFNDKYSLVSFLNLKDNKIGAESDKNLHSFFAALFSIQSIQRLGLDIRNNKFTSKHFNIMLTEWKRCGNEKKLRQLHCQGNEMSHKQKYTIGEISPLTFM